MDTILRYQAVRSNRTPRTLFFTSFKFTVTNNNNNNYNYNYYHHHQRLQVLSQTTFRYHHRLVHQKIRSALIRPSLFLYPDEGSLRSSEAPVSIPPTTRCHKPEKITQITLHVCGNLKYPSVSPSSHGLLT
jgi:hypothetical protein